MEIGEPGEWIEIVPSPIPAEAPFTEPSPIPVPAEDPELVPA